MFSSLFVVNQAHPSAYWDNLFSEDECKEIIKIGTLLNPLSEAGLGNKNNVNEVIRKNKVSWIENSEDTKFIYEKIEEAIITLNEHFFNFDLTGFVEYFQFTEYNAPDNFYAYHTDSSRDTPTRKLSFTLQLTPQDQYEGGDLELFYLNEPNKMKKDVGRLVVFPSYTLHRVLPVTKGTRHSLVGWVNGLPFK
jgi:PKHD-type hydroxylase